MSEHGGGHGGGHAAEHGGGHEKKAKAHGGGGHGGGGGAERKELAIIAGLTIAGPEYASSIFKSMGSAFDVATIFPAKHALGIAAGSASGVDSISTGGIITVGLILWDAFGDVLSAI